MTDRRKYLALYLGEARRRLQETSAAVDALEAGDSPTVSAERAYRNTHTLKGMSAQLGLGGIAALSHATEDLFEALLKGDTVFEEPAPTLLRNCLERLETMLGVVAGGQEPEAAPDLEQAIRTHIRTAGVSGFTVLHEATEPPIEPPGRGAGRPKGEDSLAALGELLGLSQRLRTLAGEDPTLAPELARLEAVTRRLYSELAELRQQRFEGILPDLRRHVRTLARSERVEAELETIGEQTLVDPTVLSQLQGVLVHLINNALLHGIEDPKERRRNGKPRQGRLALVVERDGDNLVVDLSDDGRGFPIQKLKAAKERRGRHDDSTERTEKPGEPTAKRRGLRLEHIEDPETGRAIEWAFEDAVSTADQVGAYAGRGRGLGDVRFTIAAMGGHIEVHTSPNQGTRFRMTVPVRQRIGPLLLVEESGLTVGVPATVASVGADARSLRFLDGSTRRVDRVLGTIDALVSPAPFPFSLLPRVSGTTVAPDGGILFVVDADIL